jgi:hypothetical protein
MDIHEKLQTNTQKLGAILQQNNIEMNQYFVEKERHEPKRVFLGGTCNGSTWRDKFIPLLNIDYFNPVVPTWDESAKQEELFQRRTCSALLYVITPKMVVHMQSQNL